MSSIKSRNAALIATIAAADDLPQRLARLLGATAGSSSSVLSRSVLAREYAGSTIDSTSRSENKASICTAAPKGYPASSGTQNSFARRMAPELSYGRHAGPAPATARSAAVVLLLFRRDGQWHVPLTQRPANLLRHGGQISLPGGRIEVGESSEAAALRELTEELGISAPATMLGQLPDRYVYASDYVVTPHVAVTTLSIEWKPDAHEVERVVELPLSALLDSSSIGRMTLQRGPLVFHAPCFVFGDDRVWGATAIILAELVDTIHLAFNSSSL
jgi:8-oxo-dGTP pyrophosphatase MutT (NUDIX family)